MSIVQSVPEELTYHLSGPRYRLIFTGDVLRNIDQKRQRRCLSTEAGGQLFARFTAGAIVVEVATGPYREDNRSRFQFTPDRLREQRDIDEHFARRLHFIGNWHTHPQKIPTPSGIDLKNTRQRFAESEHTLKAFLMVIVGLASFPSGLYVALVNSDATSRLSSFRENESKYTLIKNHND